MKAVLVSGYPICLDGLQRLMTEITPPSQISTFATLDAALAHIRETPADLMVLDVTPDDGMLSDLASVVQAIAPAPLVLFTVLAPRQAQLAYEKGVKGVLSKTAPPDLAVAALKLVLAGGLYFSDFSEFAAAPRLEANLKGRLSARQLEVLRLIEIGQTNKEIAKALGISVATVKLHVQAILNVTGARNRTEAALRARGQIR